MRRRLQTYLDFASAHPQDVSIILFALAGFAGLFEAQHSSLGWGEGFEMVQIARNLAAHGTFANPFSVLPTGATAANPPMYPFLLALLMKLAVNDKVVLFLAFLGVTLMNAAVAAMLPYLSVLFFNEILSGIVAALCWILAIQPIVSWDTSYTTAGLLLFTLLTASHAVRREHFVLNALVAGLLAGVIFLFNPAAILIYLPWLACLFARQPASLRRTATQYAAVLLLTASLLPLAWALRNHLQLGAFVIRTNLGMTLYASNNDCAEPSLFEEFACHQTHHPNGSLEEAMLLRTFGEVEFDRIRVADTYLWIKNHRSRFVGLTMSRFLYFWFPPKDPFSGYHAYAISAITIMSVPGLFLLFLRRVPFVYYFSIVSVAYPLIYYIVVTDIRYRYPILWLSLLPAGYFISELLGVKREHIPTSSSAS